MARTTTLTDDLTGEHNAEERQFSVGGTNYAIDLTEENYAKFLELVEPYRAAARVAKRGRKSKAPVLTPEERADMREWAVANGKPLASRGRFPTALINEYFDYVEAEERRALAVFGQQLVSA